MRPRCREWLPLATQQLRLRNLVRIHGMNIECPIYGYNPGEDTLIYYTLHNTKDDAPFYESEALPQRHKQQKWAEITCGDILKSNANCVCVKVWARHTPSESNGMDPRTVKNETDASVSEHKETQTPMSALSQKLSNACLSPNNLPRPPDKLLFTWGVYFSGLVLLSQHVDSKCQPNSLIFQLNGDYFTSPEKFTTASLREQLSLNSQRYSYSLPKSTKSQSRNAFAINSPQVSRSSSPLPVADKKESEDLLDMSKVRYGQLFCTASDVRKSYDLEKLLQLQNVQRLHLQKMRESQEIAQDIAQLSVYCVTEEKLKRKPRSVSLSMSSASASSSSYYHHHHSMGRALTELLSEEHRIDPQVLLQAQHLQRTLESLRCRQRLLKTEYESYSKRISKLRQKLSSETATREQRQMELLGRVQELEDDKHRLHEAFEQLERHHHRRRQIADQMERRMSLLCIELREIYPIYRSSHGLHTVCGIPFPNMDAYLNDVRYANYISMENISPMALSASLGYVAHLVQMIAVVINRPLRNPIVHEGSRSRILDIVKDIPSTSSREYPLYTRSIIPSKPVKYAIYLLNQNVAQLCHDITGIRCDLRATIENLLLMFATLAEIEQTQRDVHTRVGIHTHPNNRLTIELHDCGNNNLNSDETVDNHAEMATSHHGHMGNGADVVAYDCCDNGSSNTSEQPPDHISKSHSSIDMNHVAPMAPPHHVSAGLTTTASAAIPKLLALQQKSGVGSGGQASPIDVSGGDRNSTHQRTCRSVGSYSDSDDDLKTLLEHQRNSHRQYSISDSNITVPGLGGSHP